MKQIFSDTGKQAPKGYQFLRESKPTRRDGFGSLPKGTTINPQVPGVRHYSWRHKIDHLRPKEKAEMRLLEFRTFKISNTY